MLPSPLVAMKRPFVGTLHPQAEALRLYGRAWIQQVGLVQSTADLAHFDAALYWQLVAEVYPTAPWEVLTLAHDWSCWGFYVDDFDDSSHAAHQPEALQSFFKQVLAVLRDQTLPSDPPLLLRVLWDIWQRMCRHSDSVWQQRFHATLAESLAAWKWEAQNRVAQHIPSVQDYLVQRRKTSGWLTLALFVDLAQGRTLPEYLYQWPPLRQLLDSANNVICWSNDFYSYAKERVFGEVNNLIPVIQAAYHCNEKEAIQQVVTWHNDALRECSQWGHLIESFSLSEPGDSDHLQTYFAFCKHAIAGNDAWTQISGRYQRPSSTR